jgi:hypothetical protein
MHSLRIPANGGPMRLQNGDRVVVCDTCRYVIYENRRNGPLPDLHAVDFRMHYDHAGMQKPPIQPDYFDHSPSARKNSCIPDWQHMAEHRVIRRLAHLIFHWSEHTPSRQFILIADDRSMRLLRGHLPGRALSRLLASIIADSVDQPPRNIAGIIASYGAVQFTARDQDCVAISH